MAPALSYPPGTARRLTLHTLSCVRPALRPGDTVLAPLVTAR